MDKNLKNLKTLTDIGSLRYIFIRKRSVQPIKMHYGRLIECEDVDDFRFLKIKVTSDHQSSLDYFKGI